MCAAVGRGARVGRVLGEHPLDILLDVLEHSPTELRLHAGQDRCRRESSHAVLVTPNPRTSSQIRIIGFMRRVTEGGNQWL